MIRKPPGPPLQCFPRLDARYEDNDRAAREAPLPAYARVLEHGSVEPGDVDRGEDGEGAQDDGVEEKFVGVDVVEEGGGEVPRCRFRSGVGVVTLGFIFRVG